VIFCDLRWQCHYFVTVFVTGFNEFFYAKEQLVVFWYLIRFKTSEKSTEKKLRFSVLLSFPRKSRNVKKRRLVMQITEKRNEEIKKKIYCHECSGSREIRTIFFNNTLHARRRGVYLCSVCIGILADLLTTRN